MRPPYLAQIESPAPSLLIKHDQQQSQQCDYYLPGTEKPRYLTYIFMFNLLHSFPGCVNTLFAVDAIKPEMRGDLNSLFH